MSSFEDSSLYQSHVGEKGNNSSGQYRIDGIGSLLKLIEYLFSTTPQGSNKDIS